jgi:hypothetical protein
MVAQTIAMTLAHLLALRTVQEVAIIPASAVARVAVKELASAQKETRFQHNKEIKNEDS